VPSRLKVYFALAVLAIAAGIGLFTLYQGATREAGTGTGQALVGGPFTLTDHNGRQVTDADFKGKYALIFFGYTYCPDVCPTELQVMTAALSQMGEKARSVTPVFISVDPERDTPEVLKSYVENFSPDLVGLTGSPEQVAAAAKAYRVYYAKSGKTDTPDYLVDHSSIIYLMDPQGRFLKHFTYTTDAAALASSLADVMAATP
jgi:protein SCO1/2